MCRGACKPGSVTPPVSRANVTWWDAAAMAAIPLGDMLPCRSSDQPGRSVRNTPAPACAGTRRPYSVLLRVGFAVRPLLPAARCALTAPFHPYLINQAVCSLWHFPWTSQQATRPAGVTRHPCFVEPGLSSASCDDAAARPPGEVVLSIALPSRKRGYLAFPVSRSSSKANRIAQHSPSTCPSMICGRQRRWNARIAAGWSEMS